MSFQQLEHAITHSAQQVASTVANLAEPSVAHTTAMSVAPPSIVTRDAAGFPSPPAGQKYTNLIGDPNGTTGDLRTYPVLLMGSYTYYGMFHFSWHRFTA